MHSLARVASKPGASGEPLPPVFTSLEKAGIRPRRGQVTMLAAPPNGGKSFLALYWTIRLVDREGLTCLYVSADTDPFTMKKRATAILTGDDIEEIERKFLRGRGGEYNRRLGELTGFRLTFESDPSFDYMTDEILAFHEAWGDYPDVIVVDNLCNVVAETADEWTGLKNVTKGLHRMARQTNSAVFVLHHQNEGHGNPRYPGRRQDVTGKVNQLPEMILTLGFDSAPNARLDSYLRVACVKNRSGRHDASGKDWVELIVDVAKGAIYEDQFDKEIERVA